jgi:hypothetical protein
MSHCQPYRKAPLFPVLLAAMVLFQGHAHAETPATDNTPILFRAHVPFSEQAVVNDAIRQECPLEKYVVDSILESAKDYEVPLVGESDVLPEPATRELTVEITEATPGVFVFFSMFSKPARLVLNIKVTEGGNVLLEKSRTYGAKHAGPMGLDGHVCARLQKCATAQGNYINKLIKQKLYPRKKN